MVDSPRARYLMSQLIPDVENQLVDVEGFETLLRKLRNEPWRGSRKEAAIFHAERALEYHRESKLVAIERYERINDKRVFYDLIINEPVEPTGEFREVIVEVKNWGGWNRLALAVQRERLLALERQILSYARSGRAVRLEFKSFIPDKVMNSAILTNLIKLGKLDIRFVT